MRTPTTVRLAAVAGALALATTAVGPATAGDATGDSDLLPEFTYTDVPLPDPEWDDTGERIFPSVIRAADYVEDPLGEYYLYYAPHENPGGIGLAYADDLDGPWTEYAENPLVGNVWDGIYDVSHVSSPHVIWNEDEELLFLFFHGENDVTRYATSRDGVDWTYGDVAIRTDDTTGRESSYARVYERSLTGSDTRYVMTFMDNPPSAPPGAPVDEARRIRWATSADMRTWEIQPEPLARPGPMNQGNVSGAYLLDWNGTTAVVYHGSDGDMWATEVGPDLDLRVPLGRVHEALDTAPDLGRSAAPTFYVDAGDLHVFYESGSRLTADIAHAKGALRPTDDVTRELTCTATVTPRAGRGSLQRVSVDVDLADGVLGPYGFTLTDVAAENPRDVVGLRTGTADTDGWLRIPEDGTGEQTVTLTYTGRDEIGRPASCTTPLTEESR